MKIEAVVALVALALGCSGEARPPAASPAPSPPAPSAPARAQEDEAQATVDASLAQVSELRQLGAIGGVRSKVIGRAELLRRMKEDLFAELEPELIQGTSELLFALGASSADLDYLGSILTLLGSQLAGFYDPRVKEMVLLDDLGEEAEAATLSHELVHALQDQHYNLEKLVKWSPGRGDVMTAIQCLAEGDATSAMLDAMLAPQGRSALDLPENTLKNMMSPLEAEPDIASVPPMLKRSVVAPYADGLAFTHALRRRGGWAAVDAAWRDLPASSEQILHPDKYFSKEAPERVPVPLAAPGGPEALLYHDVIGEQGLRIVFEEWVPLTTAAETAAGWAGDSVAVYSAGERRGVAIRVRFDDEAHAIRAHETLARGALTEELETRQGDRRPPGVAREAAMKAIVRGGVCRERERRGPFAVVRAGRDLGVALGPYQRRSGGAKSDATCATGLRWADSIARAP
ncbi:MAG TPA: hypothetical protein VGK73_03830 [Polyangiaceae bacterium]